MAAQVMSVDKEQYQVEAFKLNSFSQSPACIQSSSQDQAFSKDQASSQAMDAILAKLDTLSDEILSIKQYNAQTSQKLDTQAVEALTSLNNHAKQFDRITDVFEQKLIAYSLKIASKIIQQEVQQNSNQIALDFAKDIIVKLKDATRIAVHVNPKNYEYLNSHLDMGDTIALVKDSSVSVAGIVISSDIGNFDATIESKLETLTQSVEALY